MHACTHARTHALAAVHASCLDALMHSPAAGMHAMVVVQALQAPAREARAEQPHLARSGPGVHAQAGQQAFLLPPPQPLLLEAALRRHPAAEAAGVGLGVAAAAPIARRGVRPGQPQLGIHRQGGGVGCGQGDQLRSLQGLICLVLLLLPLLGHAGAQAAAGCCGSPPLQRAINLNHKLRATEGTPLPLTCI